MKTHSKPKATFKAIAIIALIWNIFGIISFAMNTMVSEEALQALPDAERALYETTPLWIKVIYGLAVFSGTLASIMLLMKKAAAYRIFIISFIAVAVQMTYSVLFTKSMEVFGPAALAMPVIVTLFALFLVLYSRLAMQKGWLN